MTHPGLLPEKCERCGDPDPVGFNEDGEYLCELCHLDDQGLGPNSAYETDEDDDTW